MSTGRERWAARWRAWRAGMGLRSIWRLARIGRRVRAGRVGRDPELS